MSVVRIEPADATSRLEFSRTRLLEAAPDFSAARLLGGHQRRNLGIGLLLLVACLLLWFKDTIIVAVALCTGVYLATVVHRVVVTALSRREGNVIHVSVGEARAVADADLPIYTVLVPLFHEPEVVGDLLNHLGALEYPADRLDLKLLLEADDERTIEAAMSHPLSSMAEIVLVPAGEPRTKPKALNYGLTLASGEFVTIYDAEDQPDPLQLRRAVVAFGRQDDEVACLQAELTYRNAGQNIITRWFTIEYLMWFTLFLPGLAAIDAPLPLGGTSNHIRRAALEGLGGWDPYNVTEDADLGVRLHRVGWRCAVLGSQTWEEANSDFVNWMKQRSRWYKGYLQTWLVHMRHPVRLWRELGPGAFAQFNLFVGGTPLLALLNPLFWALTVAWFLGRFHLISEVFPAPVYYAGLVCWALGNVSVAYITVLAARRTRRLDLVLAACLVPLYWLMMSLSAIKAGIQLLTAPTFWEKTTHGLERSAVAAPSARGAGANLDVEEVHARPHDPEAQGAPALVASSARSRSTPDQLLGAAQALRLAGVVAAALLLWLVAGTVLLGSHDQHAAAARPLVSAIGVPGRGQPIARLKLAAAGIDVTVLQGADASTASHGPGHVTGSALPGSAGRAIIVGHRRLWGAAFRHLDRARPGDPIEMTTPWGPARYRVTSSTTMAVSHVDVAPSPHGSLTLVTDGSRLGRATVVTARLVSAPLADVPSPAAGYPSLPGSDAMAFIIGLAWLAVAAVAWRARRPLTRHFGRLVGLMASAPLAAIAVGASFAAIAHAFSAMA